MTTGNIHSGEIRSVPRGPIGVGMFGSLGVRVYGVAAVVGLLALLLGGLLLNSNERSREAFRWVRHTQDVIISLDLIQLNLGQAESSLRGFLLSDDPTYLARFDIELRQAAALRETIAGLVADNPRQTARAARLQVLAAEKARLMSDTVRRGRLVGAKGAANPARRDRARSLMGQIAATTAAMRSEETALLFKRTTEAARTSAQLRMRLLAGCPLLALLIGAVAWQIRASIARPLDELLEAVTRFGAGDHAARAKLAGSSNEFRRLGLAYNGMAEQLGAALRRSAETELKLAQANAALVERGRALETRQASISLLSEMSQRLQAIEGEGELDEVLRCFLPLVFPELAGALFIHNHSRNMLIRLTSWGSPSADPEAFQPSQCWGLRRGQAHAVDRPGTDIVCAHAESGSAVGRLCEPVIAGGEVLGLLYVEGLTDPEQRFRLDLLMENVALALVNDNLRSRLREQSIRDPLTTLFNRRYLEEAVLLETARAERNGSQLAIVMADIDHFKRFNDGFGHEAGDALLREVARKIQAQFRHGDIVCRYGGEEFMVIAPGASRTLICQRIEKLRQLIAETTIEHRGQRLGPVTMSFGIDVWTPDQDRAAADIVAEADRALFRAKRLGRNRIEIAHQAEVQAAAE